MTHQLNIRTTIELSKKCSENSSLKIWNQCHIHIECNRWICLENQLCGFYFKITLTGNELSIPNHEVHGFSNSFQLKMKKITMQTDWPNTFLPTTWERSFEEMFFVESQRQLWCIISHPKKAHIDGSMFFQNPSCWFVLQHFWASFTKPTTLSKDFNNLFFRAL